MKQLFLAAGLIGIITAQAQIEGPDSLKTPRQDTLQFNVDGSTITIQTDDLNKLMMMDINKIVQEAMSGTESILAEQDRDLKEIDERLKNGEITEEEAEVERDEVFERTEARMDALGERMDAMGEEMDARMETYSEQWERWGEEYGEQWERWAERWEDEADSNGTAEAPAMPPMPPLMPPMPGVEDPDTDHDHSKKKKRKKPRTETVIDIHYGMNNWLNGSGQLSGGAAELETWKSDVFELGMSGKTRIGAQNSPLYFKWGGSFTWHDFRLKGDRLVEKGPDAVAFVDTALSISKSQLEVAYFNIPLMLQLDFSKKGMDNGFTLGVGGYGGVRLGTHRELRYNDLSGDKVKVEQRNNFFMNDFRYGLMGQIGYGSFKVTAQYDLNTLFKENKGPDYQLASVSIGFTF